MMKSIFKTLLLVPLFVLLLFTSCQDEVIEITEPGEVETLVAESSLSNLMRNASIMDGSYDNILDNASCIAIKLPVTVGIKGQPIVIESRDDYEVIEAIFNEFHDDIDALDFVFPITIILENHDEVVVEADYALREYVEGCKGENEEDEDIECIDFQYPISFSVYNTDFQVTDVVSIENDKALQLFIKRIKNEQGLLASLNFPVTMELSDGTEIVVSNNEALQRTIEEAKDACDEDDDNDFADDDFTKKELDEYLKSCPWRFRYTTREYDAMMMLTFKEDNVVLMGLGNGDILPGIWRTRVTDRGALLKLEFDNRKLVTDTEYVVYDIGYGEIRLVGDGDDIGFGTELEKNCEVKIDSTKERIKSNLQKCYWRIPFLNIDGVDNEAEYIGALLDFKSNNTVELRTDGEVLRGGYEIEVINNDFILQISLDGRPDLALRWSIHHLEEDLIKLANNDSRMTLKGFCLDPDTDYMTGAINSNFGEWEVVLYKDKDVDKTQNYNGYAIGFQLGLGGKSYAEGNGDLFEGSWLVYRDTDLFLGLSFRTQNELFSELTHRWKIVEITKERIELEDLNQSNDAERVLVLEKK